MNHMKLFRVTLLLLVGVLFNTSFGFVVKKHSSHQQLVTLLSATSEPKSADADEVIARRIVVTGDVQGGYYRSCVRNEAGRFRKLVGNMTPVDEKSREAEIYVEGKRRMVDGFVRWCRKSNVGLSQVVQVKEVREEEPTGLYEDFYVQTR